jgi:hypothetical protein
MVIFCWGGVVLSSAGWCKRFVEDGFERSGEYCVRRNRLSAPAMQEVGVVTAISIFVCFRLRLSMAHLNAVYVLEA